MLLGKDCFSTEVLFDQLTRASTFYGHGGIPMAVISGIDIALWDIKGKYFGVPVSTLLGGRFREDVKAYATEASSVMVSIASRTMRRRRPGTAVKAFMPAR